MITIWGRPNSSNVMPVMWAIAELGLDHRLELVGSSFGGVTTPAYLAMNPNGRVPLLQVGDFTLWESNAIIRYLVRLHGAGSLLPDNPEDQALAEQWMDWQKTTLTGPMTDLFWRATRTEPPLRDPAAIASAARATEQVLSVLDSHLAGRDFVVGARLTMGDLPLGALVNRWYGMPIDRPTLPNLQSWYERLKERPAFRTHVMIDIGTTPAEWYKTEFAFKR
jgi:glutathione S-transferase